MIKRFIRGFLIVLGLIAFFSGLCMAGNTELYDIQLNQILVRVGGALIFLIVCFIGQAILKEDK